MKLKLLFSICLLSLSYINYSWAQTTVGSTFFSTEYAGSLTSDTNLLRNTAEAGTLSRNNGILRNDFNNAVFYRKLLEVFVNNPANSVNLNANAVLVVKARSNRGFQIDVRIADRFNNGSGDNSSTRMNVVADSTNWTYYRIDFMGRLNGVASLRGEAIRTITFFNTAAGNTGWLEIDSLGIGTNASNLGAATRNNFSFANDFNGNNINDNLQFTTGDGGASFVQSNGTLKVNLNNFGPNFRKPFETTIRRNSNAIDLSNNGMVSFRARANDTLSVNVRLLDTNLVNSGDNFQSWINIPADNQWRTYTINMMNVYGPAGPNFNPMAVKGLIFFSTGSSGVILNGTLEIDSLRMGNSDIAPIRLSRSAWFEDFTGTVLNDPLQITTSDGGATLSRNNELTITLTNFGQYRKVYETALRNERNALNLSNDAELIFKAKASTEVQLSLRIGDTTSLLSSDSWQGNVTIPGDNVYRTYRVNMRTVADLIPNFQIGAVYRIVFFNITGGGNRNGTLTLDSIQLGKDLRVNTVLTENSFFNDFNGTELNDSLQIGGADGASALSQNGTLTMTLNNLGLYQRYYSFGLRTGITPLNLSLDGKVRVKLRSTTPLTVQFRLVDMNGQNTGDNFVANRAIPGDNQWRWYTIDLRGRFAANPSFTAELITGFEMRNYGGGAATGVLEMDSLKIGNEPCNHLTLSTNGFSSNFCGGVLNTANSATTSDGSIDLRQDNGLFVTLNNSRRYQKFTLELTNTTRDLTGLPLFSVDMRGDTEAEFQVRLMDDANVLTPDLARRFTVNNTNTFATYQLNFSGATGNANLSRMKAVVIWVNEDSVSGNYAIRSLSVGDQVVVSSEERMEATNFLKVFPNPASTTISMAGVQEGATYRLSSVLGALKGEGKLAGNTLSIAHLPAGVYLLTIEDAKGKKVAKFIKE